jgi:transposase-like protein
VDHEGEVLEAYVTKKRDKAAALKFLRKVMKRYGKPEVLVTDKRPSYHAAMKVIGNEGRQETGRPQTTAPKILTSLSADESEQCRASGECEVFRNSLQCIRLYTTMSITREISRGEPASNRYVTPPFANGGNFSSCSTC